MYVTSVEEMYCYDRMCPHWLHFPHGIDVEYTDFRDFCTEELFDSLQ